ncbi:MAG: discoidin domain-containing protein [Flavobacteriales bacterium]|nr:discoidin domain-containing protein [Flavobacteriales bacterium]
MKKLYCILNLLIYSLAYSQTSDQLIRIQSVSNLSTMNAITNPLEGNLIYVESTSLVYYYNGANWVSIASTNSNSTNGWQLLGNTATSSDFIGTTNNTDFNIRTNNTQRMTVKNDGKVGIGTNNPTGIFEVSTQGTNQNLIPPMSSNTDNNISVSVNFHSGHTSSLTNSAFHIFDNNNNTSITASSTAPTSSTITNPAFWVMVDFGNINYVVNSYDFRVDPNESQNTPNKFKLEGSNDGTNWTSLENLHTINESAYQWNPLQSFNITNTTSYRYYKFHVYEINSNVTIGDAVVGECKLIELNLYGVISSFSVATNGNVGVGTVNPSEKLQVLGNILASGTITPDYVFEHYFEGKSQLKPEYQFTELEKTIEFAKKHHHLPNIPSAKEVKKQGGILLNKAVEQNLEKIEELHLHIYQTLKEIEEIEKLILKLD